MTWSSVGATIGLLAVALVVYKAVNLYRWVQVAARTELPYVITPALETEIWGYLLTPILRIVYHDYLLRGEGWPHWCRFMIKDWAWEDKRRAHDKFGDVFLVVSPEGIICYSADAAMGHDVMNRRQEFTKPRDKYKLLEPYGPNVATAEGKTYRFHVRITAPPFGDMSGANDLVWNETMSQTRLLMNSWSQHTSRELQLDVNGLTLAVISLAGFGKRLDWTSNSGDTNKSIPPGYKLSFLKAISDTTGHMIAILLLPNWLLRLTPLRKAALAHTQLDKYMREMIRAEKIKIRENKDHQSASARGNLLTSVMNASASEAAASIKAGGHIRKEAFTEDEVMGNLFIYLLAGYETTANAIVYGLIVLALRPDLQDNVIAEVDRVYAEAASEHRRELTYANDFEKLQYTYGFMYETFRLFPGVINITKMVKTPTEILVTSPNPHEPARAHILPKECRVYLSAPAVHYSERYWPSPRTLDPSRWLDNVNAVPEKTPEVADKKVVAADKTRQMRGTFLTFSEGARACLGRKFAQAEYIGFLAALLKDFRVVLGEGMDPVEVENDLYLRCAGKVTLSPLDKVKLGLEKRGK
ncbi:MAG: hypothetical protein M1830_010020 [Pleopsidium flavum]|nr:MAG: hypothetical protein M1830_010020 [Pleopsidium flavum]